MYKNSTFPFVLLLFCRLVFFLFWQEHDEKVGSSESKNSESEFGGFQFASSGSVENNQSIQLERRDLTKSFWRQINTWMLDPRKVTPHQRRMRQQALPKLDFSKDLCPVKLALWKPCPFYRVFQSLVFVLWADNGSKSSLAQKFDKVKVFLEVTFMPG